MHVFVSNHTWRTSDSTFLAHISAQVACVICGVTHVPPQRARDMYDDCLCVAPYRGGRLNRISRLVARLTHFGSAVSLLTPKCLLGARHVVHEMQMSVLVARAVFVLRCWCATLSPSLCPAIVAAPFHFLGHSQKGGRMLSADHVFRASLPSPLRASW